MADDANVLGANRPPKLSLIVSNISKKNNIKTLLVNAACFGAVEVMVVGQPKLDLEELCSLAFGAAGVPPSMQIKRFSTLEECRRHVLESGGCICGIEILSSAREVTRHPFRGDTALLLGNEGTGLSSSQLRACDHFVYIAQHGGGTASLNVSVAAAIAMHHFALFRQKAAHPSSSISLT